MVERYIQVWASENGRVSFPSIITLWDEGNALTHKLEVAKRRSLASHYTLTTAAFAGGDNMMLMKVEKKER